MVKIGLIGCGFIGDVHARCYHALYDKDVVVNAVCDIQKDRAEKAALIFNCSAYTDGDEMIKNADIDTVDVCLPTYLHTKYACAAMENGKNVFLEKPVCLTPEEGERLINLQRKTGVSVMVGQVVRMWKEYKWLADAVSGGIYGKVLSARFYRQSTRPLWPWENWLEDPAKGGTMALDFHVHDVDFMRSVFGEPKSVSSHAMRSKNGIIQQIYSHFDYGDKTVTVDGCWEDAKSYPFGASFKVTFEEATAELYGGNITVYLKNGGKICPELHDENEQYAELGAYYSELKYFIKRISLGLPIEIATLDDSVKTVELVLKEIENAGGAVKTGK